MDTKALNRLNLIRDRVYRYDVSPLYDDPNPIIKYSRDQYGLRGTYGSPDNIDILTVGGSTTEQRFIRDGETWQDVLQECFERTGPTIIVANAGVGGQSTYGHIKNFEWWFPHVPGLKPSYVLFYIGLNDFYVKVGKKQDSLVLGTLRGHSALWNIQRTLRGVYRAIVIAQVGYFYVDFGKIEWTKNALWNDYGFMAQRLAEYASRLRTLLDMTYTFGAKPILVSQPSRRYKITLDGLVGHEGIRSYDDHQFNGVDYYHMMRRLDSVTAAVAGEKGALFVDLASQKGWTDTDFHDFLHMTPQGVRKVGALLCDALNKSVSFDKKHFRITEVASK